jgi:hypothetical protein
MGGYMKRLYRVSGRCANDSIQNVEKFSGFVLASKILGAHGTLPAHRYTGVHKCAAPFSARREPRARPQT